MSAGGICFYCKKRECECEFIEPTKPFITGLMGCSCHPFKSWKECDQFHSQKLNVGDFVRHRCLEKTGHIVEVCRDEGNYYIVKFGNRGVQSDNELAHGAELMRY
jgi:hypothetical protein